MKLYAAYGSNINLEQMAHRCPDAVVVGKGYLHNYELAFQGTHGYGVATVKPRRGRRVPILLWSISEKDEQALDIYEGWPRLYRKEVLRFSITQWLDGNTITLDSKLDAMIYIMNYGEIRRPSSSYYSIILTGYRTIGFSRRYLDNAYKFALNGVWDNFSS